METEDRVRRGQSLRAYIEGHFQPWGVRSWNDLARKARKRPNTFSDWAKGSVPSPETMEAIAPLLGVSVEALWAAYEARGASNGAAPASVTADEIDAVLGRLSGLLRELAEHAAKAAVAEVLKEQAAGQDAAERPASPRGTRPARRSPRSGLGSERA